MLIEIKIGSAKFIENNMGIPQEIKKKQLPCNSAIPLLGVYPKEMKTGC